MENKDIMSINEVADLIGLQKPTIYALTHRREIPFYKRPGGRKLYFRRSEIESWLLSRRYSTKDEMEQEAATDHMQRGQR